MRILSVAFLLFIAASAVAQNHDKCGFDHRFDAQIAENPKLIKALEDHYEAVAEVKRKRLAGEVRAGGNRVIPVVFHVIHEGGTENISYEQIEDQIRILNEDYTRTNADATNTRAEFLPVAADCQVQFELARLDPEGNCTDGVIRVYSPLTNNADDDVKALSYWNNDRYLNIWVVRTIDSGGGGGTTLGYAQFPGFGSDLTDGLVIRSDYIGSIGTAASSGSAGRTATHEVGHWLGLFHTFQGGCNGGFGAENIDDTPPTADQNFGCPLNLNSCSTDNPDLPDMVENYMDYSDGDCQNILTQGQKDVVDAVLGGVRSLLVSPGNASFTGINNAQVDCAPIADFLADRPFVCEGDQLTFSDYSYNGEVSDYDWTFDGGSPATSQDTEPQVTYNTVGYYDVTMQVSNPQGSDQQTHSGHVHVIPAATQISQNGYSENFDPWNEVTVYNLLGLQGTWGPASPGFASEGSFRMDNWNSPVNAVDEFVLPSIDLTAVADPVMTFKVAHRQRSGGANSADSDDELKVYISKDCGVTWSLRFNKSGDALTDLSPTGSQFTPSSDSQWKDFSANLGIMEDEPHVLIKFQSTSDGGNHIYVDNINIPGPASIEEGLVGNIRLQPNPSSDISSLMLDVKSSEFVQIDVLDVVGRSVAELYSGDLAVGSHRFNMSKNELGGAGIYLVRITTNGQSHTERLILN